MEKDQTNFLASPIQRKTREWVFWGGSAELALGEMLGQTAAWEG